jgi:thioredoxin 2
MEARWSGEDDCEMSDAKVVSCPHCSTKNRVRAAATGAPHCGKCGRPLPWLTEAGAADFAEVVEKSPVPVLVDFWAPWCGPCRMVSPVVEQLATELAGRLKVAKVNTDEQPGLQQRFGVQGIPSLVLIESGRERDRVVGALGRDALRSWLEARLAPAAIR